MKIRLLAVGTKMPAWVTQGVTEYTKRLPTDCQLEIVEINPGFRGKSASKAKAMAQEAEAINKALRGNEHIVTLEVEGKNWSTEELSDNLEHWRSFGQDIAFIVGGADGLDPSITVKARQRWSLSRLTLPHPMVRIMVAEQVYRAWTILQGHPYHK